MGHLWGKEGGESAERDFGGRFQRGKSFARNGALLSKIDCAIGV
jgi:uncharacterized Zn finger protein